jgi:uncharacterized protein (TIGR02996 family)
MSHPDRKRFATAIRDNPSDPIPRLLFADWLDENRSPGLARLLRLGAISGGGYGGGGYGDGDGDGDGDGGGYGGGGYGDGDGDGGGYGGGGYGNGGGYGGGGYGDGGGGYGDGDGGYGDGGYGDGDGDGGGYLKVRVSEGINMENGLHIITVAAGYSPYVLIGWAKVGDLFVNLYNCRVIRRFGSRANLAAIAKEGPQQDTELLAASPVEHVAVMSVGRAIPCNEKAWRNECPKPPEFPG